MAKIEIPTAESGVIRIFSVSRPMAQMSRMLKQQPKAALASDLLDHTVTDDNVELFPLSDLTGVGLPNYLIEGYAVDADDIRADRRRLEALDGYVLMLFSNVARDNAVTLTPTSDLTLIGTYAEPRDSRSAAPVMAEAAKPYSGVTDAPAPPARSRTGSALVPVTAIVFLILIWWIFS